MDFSVQKVINNLIANSAIPGQGYLRLLSVDDGKATVKMCADISLQSIENPEIITINETLELPLPNKDGVFSIDGQDISLVRRATPKTPDTILSTLSQLSVEGIESVYSDIIGRALTQTINPMRRDGRDFDRARFYSKLNAAFSYSPYSRNLPTPYNSSEAVAWKNTIVIEGVEIDPKNPIPKDWRGKIDVSTTPQSEKVASVYRLAKDARVINGEIVPGDCVLDELMYSGSFAPACAPTQIYKINSTLMRHIKLEKPEEPLVAHKDARTDLFQGMNLLTGIIHDRWNQMDQITISESAAEKMKGFVYTTETIDMTSGGNEIYVTVGDFVGPDEVIGLVRSAGEESEIRARRLVRPAYVHSINKIKRTVDDKVGTEYQIVFRTTTQLESGDKLMPRSGCKGCVMVIPDEEMPETIINGEWKRLEVCVNPYPVAKRKNLSLLLEMVCNEAGIKEIEYNTNSRLAWDLYHRGFGVKKATRKRGEETKNPIAAGYIYWMRSDSLHDWRSYGVKNTKPNFQGLNPDQGRKSGIMYGPVFRILMKEMKNCPSLDRILMERNFNAGVSKLTKDLTEMLEGSL